VVTEESAMMIELSANTKKRQLRKINRLRAHAVLAKDNLDSARRFSERSRKYGLVRSRRTRAIMVGCRAYCFVVAFALICFVRTNQS